VNYKALPITLLALSTLALAQAPVQVTAISLPGKNIVLEMKLGDLKIDPSQTSTRADGSGAKIFASDNSGLVLSAFLQMEPGKSRAAECRDDWFGKMRTATPFAIDDVKLYEKGRMAVAEYVIHSAAGRNVEQKNVHAYLASRDICAEAHVSKALFHAGDEKLIDALLDTVQLRHKLDEDRTVTVDFGSPSPSGATAHPVLTPPAVTDDAMDLFRRGSVFYMQGNYRNAIEYYQPALDLEKSRPQLGKTYWTVLVDNLGMAYGISGDLERAKQTFQYGLSKAPKYPLFHYNMACAYAEGGDVESTISYLKTAYQYRGNALPGEGMPDPRKDSSFQRFMKDPRFLKTLAELGYR
jgi:tetratricopeptide (TPR) repeat protein